MHIPRQEYGQRMTGLIVTGVILLIIIFLLVSSIRAELSFIDGKFDYKVKYLFFTILPHKEKKEKPPKKKSKKKTQEVPEEAADTTENDNIKPENTSEEIPTEKPEKKSKKKKSKDKPEKGNKLAVLKCRIEQAKILWGFCAKPLGKLFKGIFLDDLVVDFKICGEDACEAAVNYGKINAIFYNGLSVVRLLFPVTVKTVDIVCDFDEKKSVYDCSLSVKLRLGTLLGVLLVIAWGFLVHLNELGKAGKPEADSDKLVGENT